MRTINSIFSLIIGLIFIIQIILLKELFVNGTPFSGDGQSGMGIAAIIFSIFAISACAFILMVILFGIVLLKKKINDKHFIINEVFLLITFLTCFLIFF